jgi:malate permease and related proteins
MIASYWRLAGLVAPIFVLLVAGFAARKARLLNPEADESLLRLVVNVLYPCVIIDAVLGNPALSSAENILVPPVLGFGAAVLGLALGLLCAPLFGLRDRKRARTFAFTVGLFNYGYIPVPLVQALFSRETMGVLFTFNLGVEIAFWTAGILVLTGGSTRMGISKMLNGPVIAVLISVIANLFRAHTWLPVFLLQAVHMLGWSAVPLALVLTGATVADFLKGNVMRDGFAVIAGSVCLRLAVLPSLFLAAALLFSMSSELKRVLVVQAAMPAAMLPVVLARHYGGDTAVALQVVLTTTLLGLLSIPFWLHFGMQLLGLAH